MPEKLPLFLIAAVLFLLQGAATAEAATLEGTVTTSDGRAVSGAMVTDALTALPQVSGASWSCTAAGGASCTARRSTRSASS